MSTEILIQLTTGDYTVDVENEESREGVKTMINDLENEHYDWFQETTGTCNWVLFNTDIFEITMFGSHKILHYKQDCEIDPVMPINASSCYGMFYGINLSEVSLVQFSTSNVVIMAHMFESTTGMTTEVIEHLTTDIVKSMHAMFADSDCEFLNLSDFEMNSVIVTSNMFAGCEYLVELKTGNWDLSALQVSSSMFRGCSALEYIFSAENWNSKWTVYDDEMFLDCFALPDYDEDSIGFAKAVTEENGGYLTFDC